MALVIDYLDQHVDAIPALARWHHAEWSAVTPHLSVPDRIAGFRARAQRGIIPTGFVALLNNTPVGMACLVESDIDTHRQLTPWLATVLVGPEFRGQGIGSALSTRATNEAVVMGVATLYLFTFDRQGFYERLGWSELEEAKYAGRSGTIMLRSLAGGPASRRPAAHSVGSPALDFDPARLRSSEVAIPPNIGLKPTPAGVRVSRRA